MEGKYPAKHWRWHPSVYDTGSKCFYLKIENTDMKIRPMTATIGRINWFMAPPAMGSLLFRGLRVIYGVDKIFGLQAWCIYSKTE